MDEQDLLTQAQQKFEQHDFWGAARLYTQLLDNDPDNLELLQSRAEIWQKLNKNKEAIKDLENVRKYEPDNALLLLTLGQLYFIQNNILDAESTLCHTIGLLTEGEDPFQIAFSCETASEASTLNNQLSADLHTLYGEVLHLKGSHIAASEQFSLALEKDQSRTLRAPPGYRWDDTAATVVYTYPVHIRFFNWLRRKFVS